MSSTIWPPNLRDILTPLLPSLPTASLSSQPAPAILRLLSPILRQRVQLLSSTSNEPWLRLLTYDKGAESRLAEVARSDRLEPHPVSGEVEVDWEYDARTQYRRLDEETLQALVVMEEFDLLFRLVWCVNDEAGGGDGWRVGEVSVPEKSSPFASFQGQPSIPEAERAFQERGSNTDKISTLQAPNTDAHPAPQIAEGSSNKNNSYDDDDDDDDDYWARYDATPARTPQVGRSPAPVSSGQQYQPEATRKSVPDDEEDDAYYSQYDSVQPAMDSHDPDEAHMAEQHRVSTAAPAPPLGLQHPADHSSGSAAGGEETDGSNGGWTLAPTPSARSQEDEERTAALAHPRPASSASSKGSDTVLKLEQEAGRQEQNEFGVKQHVSRSIRSLFLLSRTAGIDRDEFERMVKTELDVLGMVENDM
ncbi:hypothetical protein M406DRAFT_44515 [Cryphonectria parasitica EP155]|uniref:Uncharacterized protein n=1 Tax=Cryphonectria parasitica (strain ATCC 38755 / EP155) TaxID=660469 RepID=A0A9P5CSV0_CRYP1|nr:uncharacterized protein M406DRAFT_44515 [Cryphonectria parasitica EP155]KAF3769007.1 hypothetical protein M406DRAFT_44515 [Cryphonectria parasitica EP155]